MSKKIKIPATIEEATKKLEGLEALATATEWHRAALVYAYTTDAAGPGKPKRDITLYSPKQFAKLGIAGLKSDQTVRTYRKAWQQAIDDGHAEEVSPGNLTALPEIPWPPTGHTSGSIKVQFADKSVQQAADDILEILSDRPEVLRQVKVSLFKEEAEEETAPEKEKAPHPQLPKDWHQTGGHGPSPKTDSEDDEDNVRDTGNDIADKARRANLVNEVIMRSNALADVLMEVPMWMTERGDQRRGGETTDGEDMQRALTENRKKIMDAFAFATGVEFPA